METERDKFSAWALAHVNGGFESLTLTDLIAISNLISCLRNLISKKSWEALGNAVERIA